MRNLIRVIRHMEEQRSQAKVDRAAAFLRAVERRETRLQQALQSRRAETTTNERPTDGGS
jgi:hypothetical protein